MTIKNTKVDVSDIHEIPAIMREMRLTAMAEALEKDISDPNSGLMSPTERMTRIILAEYNSRCDKKTERFVKRAKLKMPSADLFDLDESGDRTLDTDILTRLSTCEWIRQRSNLIVTGPCGSGKTWISCALSVKACEQFMNVRYYSANQLILKMKAMSEKEYLAAHEILGKLDLLIMDDVGLMSYDLESCRIFFEILDTRYQSGSTLFISQFPVSSWYDLFSDKTYAESVLSRAIEKSYRLELQGSDMRVRKN
jgi:DNA replication protein DnaC